MRDPARYVTGLGRNVDAQRPGTANEGRVEGPGQVVLPPQSEVVRPIAIAVADVPKRIVIQFVAQCDQEPYGFDDNTRIDGKTKRADIDRLLGSLPPIRMTARWVSPTSRIRTPTNCGQIRQFWRKT
jgi:hypothetical protein